MSTKTPVVHTHGPQAYAGLLVELSKEFGGLCNLLPERPLEFCDRLAGYADTSTEMMLGSRPIYETVGWEDVQRELEDVYGGPAHVGEEAALAQVEDHVRSVLAEIRSGDPFDPLWAADSPQTRCCYLACRLLEPEVVVETGVAYGATSASILRALEENGHGCLHSVDLPSLRPGSERSWGAMVDEKLRERWFTYRGSSKRILPDLLRQIGPVDLFLHDSLHTRRHMQSEFETVWPHLRQRGLMMADDVERNGAFGELRRWNPALWRVVREDQHHPDSEMEMPTTFGVAVK